MKHVLKLTILTALFASIADVDAISRANTQQLRQELLQKIDDFFKDLADEANKNFSNLIILRRQAVTPQKDYVPFASYANPAYKPTRAGGQSSKVSVLRNPKAQLRGIKLNLYKKINDFFNDLAQEYPDKIMLGKVDPNMDVIAQYSDPENKEKQIAVYFLGQVLKSISPTKSQQGAFDLEYIATTD